MKAYYPNLNLEDKVGFDGQGNDTYEAIHPPVMFHYQRRQAHKNK